MRGFLFLLVALLSSAIWAYEISVGDAVGCVGQRVVVPVSIDTVQGAANVSVRIVYDAAVLKFVQADAGSLSKVLSDDFVVSHEEDASSVSVWAFGRRNVEVGVGGCLATLTFEIRDGMQGRYSDVTVADAGFGDETGVKDILVGQSVTIRNGIVRVMASIVSATSQLTELSSSRLSAVLSRAGSLPPRVEKINIAGATESLDVLAGLGLAPLVSASKSEVGTFTACYEKPTLVITGLDHVKGEVSLKVIPGEGNALVSEPFEGVLRVYGTPDLQQEMKPLSTVNIDMSSYLSDDSKGEIKVAVDLAGCSFVKVKAE